MCFAFWRAAVGTFRALGRDTSGPGAERGHRGHTLQTPGRRDMGREEEGVDEKGGQTRVTRPSSTCRRCQRRCAACLATAPPPLHPTSRQPTAAPKLGRSLRRVGTGDHAEISPSGIRGRREERAAAVPSPLQMHTSCLECGAAAPSRGCREEFRRGGRDAAMRARRDRGRYYRGRSGGRRARRRRAQQCYSSAHAGVRVQLGAERASDR